MNHPLHDLFKIYVINFPYHTHFERSNIDQLTLDSNIKIILGYQKQNERLELFVKVYENLKKYKKVRTRGIFDMRYPKGFALSYSPL